MVSLKTQLPLSKQPSMLLGAELTFRHRFSEEDTAIDYFGKQLLAAGYNYYGNEPMYSGITGQEFAADIYLGVVYYQRLRHMVLDKFQVRTTGPVDPVTRQPVKVHSHSLYIQVLYSPLLLYRVANEQVVYALEKWNGMPLSPMEPLSFYRIDS